MHGFLWAGGQYCSTVTCSEGEETLYGGMNKANRRVWGLILPCKEESAQK